MMRKRLLVLVAVICASTLVVLIERTRPPGDLVLDAGKPRSAPAPRGGHAPLLATRSSHQPVREAPAPEQPAIRQLTPQQVRALLERGRRREPFRFPNPQHTRKHLLKWNEAHLRSLGLTDPETIRQMLEVKDEWVKEIEEGRGVGRPRSRPSSSKKGGRSGSKKPDSAPSSIPSGPVRKPGASGRIR